MQAQDKYPLLRRILRTIGLSAEAVDEIVERIVDFLSEKEDKPSSQPEFPYFVRDDFLSLAEQSFYLVLKSITADWAIVCPKVALGDLFYARSSDPSKYRTHTNRIDRKHVDFLLCDPKTVRPILGIELDDKSHQRADRQTRDEFVEQVFLAAKLPLVRIPVRQSYSTSDLSSLLHQKACMAFTQTNPPPQPKVSERDQPPQCPKCGSPMVLRTAKSGTGQGNQFWGCTNFPRCRGVLKHEQTTT